MRICVFTRCTRVLHACVAGVIAYTGKLNLAAGNKILGYYTQNLAKVTNTIYAYLSVHLYKNTTQLPQNNHSSNFSNYVQLAEKFTYVQHLCDLLYFILERFNEWRAHHGLSLDNVVVQEVLNVIN